MYRMRRNLENAIVDELGSMANEDTRWTPEEVKADAEGFGMDADDFIERYLEPCIWYAVQETPDDDWDWGSYDYDEAVKMLKEQGHGLIAMIDESEGTTDFVEEISYEEAMKPDGVYPM